MKQEGQVIEKRKPGAKRDRLCANAWSAVQSLIRCQSLLVASVRLKLEEGGASNALANAWSNLNWESSQAIGLKFVDIAVQHNFLSLHWYKPLCKQS